MALILPDLRVCVNKIAIQRIFALTRATKLIVCHLQRRRC